MSELRVGVGFDAHALVEGVPLILGGVTIDYPRGLAGHSDGDVIAHALIDALLGAANLGDIGSLFPSGDEQYRGASSLDLLWEAYREVRNIGFELVNADCVLVAEEPRIGDVRDEMCERSSPEPSVWSEDAWRCVRRPRTGSASPAAATGLPRMRSHSYSVRECRPSCRPAGPPCAPLRASQTDVPRVHEQRRAARSTGIGSTRMFRTSRSLSSTVTLPLEAHALGRSLDDLPSVGWDEGFVRGMTR